MSHRGAAPRQPSMLLVRLARLRVPLGFASAAICLWLAQPTPTSIAVGMLIAGAGETLRVWAAGHIEKGREITRSGPYRLMRHPLYVGSMVLATGFVIAARSGIVAAIVLAYLVVTVGAAVRVEERALDQQFRGAYSEYREGRAAPFDRRFSLVRAMANREYRAVLGLVGGAALLLVRWWITG